MATDLKTVQDHPATLLTRHGSAVAAALLVEHEQAHDVTFAALANDPLAEIKHAFDKAGSAPVGSPEWVDGMKDLYAAASDLLGLDD